MTLKKVDRFCLQDFQLYKNKLVSLILAEAFIWKSNNFKWLQKELIDFFLQDCQRNKNKLVSVKLKLKLLSENQTSSS